jgi:hypothetical protein
MATVTLAVPSGFASWKTTLFGALTALGVYLQSQPGTFGIIGQVLSILGPVLLGVFCKDANVTGGTVVDPSVKQVP